MAVKYNSLEYCLGNFWTKILNWGRATRAEYWWAVLFYYVIGSMIATLFGLEGLWGLVTMVPFFTLTARRLHDSNHSAWHMCWSILPIIGWIVLLVLLCQDSVNAKNRFGK